jgi:hypothetical protein
VLHLICIIKLYIKYMHIHLVPSFNVPWRNNFTPEFALVRRAEKTFYVTILSYNYRFQFSWKNYFNLNGIPLPERQIKEEENSWHTFHIIIFPIFSVLAEMNITAHVASNNFGL